MEFKDVLLREATKKEEQAAEWYEQADAAEENARTLRSNAAEAEVIAVNYRRVAENEPARFNSDDMGDGIPF